jgi:hypothetical protein
LLLQLFTRFSLKQDNNFTINFLNSQITVSGESLSSDDIDDDYLYGESKDVDGLVEKWHDVVALTDSDIEASSE